MKYIKLFESKVLDDILDKMSSLGKESLTDLEKEYLSSYNDIHKKTSIEQKIRKHNEPIVEEPNSDDPEVIRLWNEIPSNDMVNFIKSNELDDNIDELDWNKLTDDVKELFQVYLYENDLLGSDDEPSIDVAEIWNTLEENEVYDFLSSNELPLNLIEKQWDKLPNEVKSIFMKYAKQNRL